MTKLKKHCFLVIITIVAFVSLIALLSPLGNPVRAVYGEAHAIAVFLRFASEFLEKTPAGEYYINLLMKHGQEQYWIVNNRPEHIDEFWQVVQMFTPGVEALVNGEGDTIRITQEQINSLREEWEWESQFASTTFREDVEKELERFSLDGFVGMTMSEAWDFINSNWTPGLTVEPLLEPISEVTTVPPVSPTPICIAGFDSNCLAEPLLVPNSNDQLAYYVYNNIYFEYPSAWHIQQNINNKDEFIIVPTRDSSEGRSISLLAFLFSSDILIENWDQVLKALPPQWERPNTNWRHLIYLNDFQGFECLWKDSDAPATDLEFFLYNESARIAVDLLARIEDNNVTKLMENSDDVNKIFPNIQHIVESIRIREP